MQNLKLPYKINPKKEAQRRSKFSGIYPKILFKRLPEIVNAILEDATINFSTKIDTQNLVVIDGNAIISVDIKCERCLNNVKIELACGFIYTPVADINHTEFLPTNYEPVEYDQDGEIDLLNMVEDEFILSLPLTFKHKLEHCEVSKEQQIFGEISQEELDRPNPFAVLKQLKK